MRTRIVMIIMAAALIALPTMAQDWQSTSVMQGSGSTYSPQVTEVGATSVVSEATTTESYSPAKAPSGPRREFGKPTEELQSDESPLGDAVLPLMLMALAFGAYVAIRKRRQQMN